MLWVTPYYESRITSVLAHPVYPKLYCDAALAWVAENVLTPIQQPAIFVVQQCMAYLTPEQQAGDAG